MENTVPNTCVIVLTCYSTHYDSSYSDFNTYHNSLSSKPTFELQILVNKVYTKNLKFFFRNGWLRLHHLIHYKIRPNQPITEL